MNTTYLLRCVDLEYAGQIARQRLLGSGLGVEPDEIRLAVDIVQTLEGVDGWKPESYNNQSHPAFELVEQSWEVSSR